MDVIYFLTRYIPFWAIPTMIIAGEFAYIYWLKSRKSIVFALVGLGGFSFLSIIFYYVAGGPERSVQALISFMRSF